MSPFRRQYGSALPEGIRIGGGQIAARRRVVIDRGSPLANHNAQAAMHGGLFGHRIVIEGQQCRGFILRKSRQINLVVGQTVDVAQITVLYRGGRKPRSSWRKILYLAHELVHLLVNLRPAQRWHKLRRRGTCRSNQNYCC